jgi:hypothetical protein
MFHASSLIHVSQDPAVRPSFSKIILLLESFGVDGGKYFPEDLLRLDEAECEKTLQQTKVEEDTIS